MGKMKEMMIDPPSGWRYGFPRIFPSEARGRTLEWLVANGYPQREIDNMGDHFYCRYWEQEFDEEEIERIMKEDQK